MIAVAALKSRRKQGPGEKTGARAVVSPARLAAFEILRRVEEDGAFAAVLLAATQEEMRADDRALCYELVLGTLRRQLWLDRLIERYSARAASSLDAPVRRALRVGLYQLRFLSRIPASAVVNESVNLAYRARVRSAAGFVNAVLRRALKEPQYDPAEGIADPALRLAVETSHPRWLIERWTNAFGSDWAEALARANNEAPPVAFRLVAARAGSLDVLEELRAAGGRLSPSEVAPDGWRIKGASARLRELARDGFIYVQDEASQLAAHLVDVRAGERVLDACAAPGSKTTYIADRTDGAALVVAGDLYEHRLRTLLESALRQQGAHEAATASSSVAAVVYDASLPLPFAESSFDRVLVDAPCTGTGTLRRNPEIRWRISPSDIADLSARQRAILGNAAKVVGSRGRLLYSTCSVEPEENEAVVASFLKENGAFTRASMPVPPTLKSVDGAARTWPQRDGADGFFIAAFERRS
ncbi:MAG TPA: 16S rRNA (cytosine(967)-C(5))-methyltransferase RsmB [Pyrinomonadaceae bacterium]|jgi:16S rRNA (cytosine967-C5)-methyltransferase|nr:16S rRNA (cytosine(967)-C(5))-methyltransferase RsmB [Pyrinomonadaceae bacterium]